jgi:hypothetical protein
MSLLNIILVLATIFKSAFSLLPFPQGSSMGVSFICFSIELKQFAIIDLSKNLHQRTFAFAENFVAWLAGSSEFLCLDVVVVLAVFDRIVG